ncbi:MAG: hypothetical protein NT167_18905 [Verrucomicrobia bacterium]|nr:hypothetical protein [Verrucomicrobiota bacterium]
MSIVLYAAMPRKLRIEYGHAEVVGLGMGADAEKPQLAKGTSGQQFPPEPGVSDLVPGVDSEDGCQQRVYVEQVSQGKSARVSLSSY